VTPAALSFTPDAERTALLAALALPEAVRVALEAVLQGPIPGASTGTADGVALPPGWRLLPDGAWGVLLLEEGAGAPRPWVAADRFGVPHLCARWEGAGLREAWLRLPGQGWLELRPDAGTHPLWGRSDALLHHAGAPRPSCGERVGWLPAQPYGALRELPPFDQPGALPPGAGSAVLNLLALLLRLQGTEAVAYRGPYPTPALFASLCRSFVPEGAPEQAEALFTRDETALAFRGEMAPNPVRWRPAPFVACRPRPELLLHLREGIETAWTGTVPFRRAAARGGVLPVGERVWSEPGSEAPDEAVGLVLLGRPWCRFYRLAPDGAVRQVAPLDGDAGGPPVPLDARWREVVFAWSTLRAHAGLAADIAALEPDLALAWRPLALRMAAPTTDGATLHLQSALAEAFRQRRVGEAVGDASGLAIMLISDALQVLAPHLRRLAQQRLAAGPSQELHALMQSGEAAQSKARTRLERALPALVAALVRGEALPDDTVGDDGR